MKFNQNKKDKQIIYLFSDIIRAIRLPNRNARAHILAVDQYQQSLCNIAHTAHFHCKNDIYIYNGNNLINVSHKSLANMNILITLLHRCGSIKSPFYCCLLTHPLRIGLKCARVFLCFCWHQLPAANAIVVEQIFPVFFIFQLIKLFSYWFYTFYVDRNKRNITLW